MMILLLFLQKQNLERHSWWWSCGRAHTTPSNPGHGHLPKPIHGSVEDTKLSTNKQHTLSPRLGRPVGSLARAETGDPWAWARRVVLDTGKAQASKRFQTSLTSRMLDVRGRLRCACNATSSSPPSEAAAPPSCPWVATLLRGRGGRISHPKSTRQRSCVVAAHTARCPRAVPHSRIRRTLRRINGQPHKHHSRPKIKSRALLSHLQTAF